MALTMHHLNGYEIVDQYAREQIAKLLFKAITFTSSSATPSSALMGSTQSVVIAWVLSKIPAALTINGNTIKASAAGSMTAAEVKETTTWTVIATDPEDQTKTATATVGITFMNNIYYGVSSDETPSAADTIPDLTAKLTNSRLQSGLTVTAGEGQYVYYCVPARLGECTFKVGGFAGGFEDAVTLSITNDAEYSEDYYVYRSTNPNLGTITIEVL